MPVSLPSLWALVQSNIITHPIVADKRVDSWAVANRVVVLCHCCLFVNAALLLAGLGR